VNQVKQSRLTDRGGGGRGRVIRATAGCTSYLQRIGARVEGGEDRKWSAQGTGDR